MEKEVEVMPILIGVDEVKKLLGVKQSRAYKVIRELNAELQAEGKATINGRISRQYLLEKFGG